MSAPNFAIFPLILGLIAVACVVSGIYLIVTSRRTVGSGPRCGHCQYNLTGSTANRCPECGRLFIEEGIVTNPAASLRKRRRIGISLIALPLIPASLGLVKYLVYHAGYASVEADRARMEADLANRHARLMARARGQPTTAPASQPRP